MKVVNLFGHKFSSLEACLTFFGFDKVVGNIALAPAFDTGHPLGWAATPGDIEEVFVNGFPNLVWVRQEDIYTTSTEGGVGYFVFDGEKITDFCLRQAVTLTGEKVVLASLWNETGAWTNTHLRNDEAYGFVVTDEEGDSREIVIVPVGDKLLCHVFHPDGGAWLKLAQAAIGAQTEVPEGDDGYW